MQFLEISLRAPETTTGKSGFPQAHPFFCHLYLHLLLNSFRALVPHHEKQYHSNHEK
jgi:hypothetical protein